MVLGNALLTFSLSRWGYRAARRRCSRAGAMLCYWICVASVGNLIDYVPIRTFTDGTDLYQDMFAVEKGFHWSPWTLLIVFGIPTAVALWYFFVRIELETLRWLFPYSAARRITVAILTALALFGFYGAAGLTGGGTIPQKISMISVGILVPIAAIINGVLTARAPATQSSH
jgi:hypothetical protein